MSKQQGRGGMGSHKHGVSGKSGMPRGLKQRLAREENKRQEKKSRRQRMYESIPLLWTRCCEKEKEAKGHNGWGEGYMVNGLQW